MMQAAIRRKYGLPQHIITIENIPKPVPKADEVLIKVEATTVSRSDTAVLMGKPFIMRFFVGLFRPKQVVPGTDFAGTITQIGSAVTNFKIGDKVHGFHDEGCSSQAQYMTFKADKGIALLPEKLSFEEAAACLEGAHYAYNFLNKVDIKAGHKILINGATGAIGSALLQFAKYHNCEVIAVCNTKNIDLIQSLKADRIIDYLQTDFTTTEATEQYDFIFDAVGKSSFGKCKPLLKKGSTYISSELGPRGENPFLALWTPFFSKKKVVFPIPGKIKDSFTFIHQLIETDQFRPIIDRRYPLNEIVKAYDYVDAGRKTGNVVVSYSDEKGFSPKN